MRTHPSLTSSVFLLALALGAEARADPPSDGGHGPATGFMLQGRLHQALGGSLIGTGRSSSETFLSTPVMPASLGYRGSFYAIGIAPTYWSLDRTSSTASALTLFGLGLHAEFAVARFFQRRGEVFVFPGFTFLLASGSSSQLAWGFTGGVGGRYWLTPGLGVSVELSESIASVPVSSSSTIDTRIVSIQTIGSIGLTVVLGDTDSRREL